MTTADDPIVPPYSLVDAMNWGEKIARPGFAGSVLAAEVIRLRAECATVCRDRFIESENRKLLAWRANEVAACLHEAITGCLVEGGEIVAPTPWCVRAEEAWQNLVASIREVWAKGDVIPSTFERLRSGESVDLEAVTGDLTDEGLAKLCDEVMATPDPDDAHYDLVMPFVVVQSKGGPFEDQSYVAGWEASEINVKLMALAAFGQAATDLVCREANWPQVSLLLMRHGWNVDESSMSIADGWVSVKVVGF